MMYKCYYKDKGKLCLIEANGYRSRTAAIKDVKESLMQDSLPYKEAVLISIK